MNIALDATPLTVPTGGVRRYTLELSYALANNYPEDVIALLSDQPFKVDGPHPCNLRMGKGPQNLMERRWWSWGLHAELSRLGSDVFHGTDFSVPYLPSRPSVMTIHDLSPWMDPGWHAQAGRVRQRTPKLLRLGLATVIITPSETVRRQVVEHFRLPLDRVIATPLAASSTFRPVATNVSRPPYFLYVGTLEPRKNLSMLMEAWTELRKTHEVDLVLAGRKRVDFTDIRPQPGLHHLGAVSDADLGALYTGALAFVYPSHYEGFGLPVLEAMQCGAAVLTSTDPAIKEVSGDAAVPIPPSDQHAWIAAMRAAIENSAWLEELRARSIRRAKLFSWSKTAALTREAYVEAIQRVRKKWASTVPGR